MPRKKPTSTNLTDQSVVLTLLADSFLVASEQFTVLRR
jgi:hypothetical protein